MIKEVTLTDSHNLSTEDINEQASAIAENIAFEEKWQNGADFRVILDKEGIHTKVYRIKVYAR
jgi:hypothetical protein